MATGTYLEASTHAPARGARRRLNRAGATAFLWMASGNFGRILNEAEGKEAGIFRARNLWSDRSAWLLASAGGGFTVRVAATQLFWLGMV